MRTVAHGYETLVHYAAQHWHVSCLLTHFTTAKPSIPADAADNPYHPFWGKGVSP